MTKVHIVARQLGLAKELARRDEKALFKWLVACLLFAKPIQQSIAWQAYRLIVEDYRYDTPRKFASCSHSILVALLGKAHYVRYDLTTAERLIKLSKKLINDHGGTVTALSQQCADAQAFTQRLLQLPGIGPKAAEIFMREAAPVLFPANPPP